MRNIAITCGLALLVMASGCSPANPPQAGTKAQANPTVTERMTYGLLGAGPVNYWEGAQRSDYRLDSEANHSTSFRTLSPNRHVLGDDREKIREIVQIQGMDAGMVIIAGSHAWVNVGGLDGLNEEQTKEKMKQLRKELKSGVPRYQVHINLPS